MASRLIITNGDSTIPGLRAAGIDAEVLPWRDALHDGPVPSGMLLEALSLIRAQFLASQFRIPVTDVNRDFSARDAKVRSHGQYERVELWFEHDLYDQLQLIQLLDFFGDEHRTEGLFLAQSGDYLGTMTPEALRDLEAAAVAVTPDHTDTARRAWAAFTASTPETMAAQSMMPVASHPYLMPAINRALQELPAIGSGLSLTQERILWSLRESPRAVAEVFQQTQEQEEARYLGDLAFFRTLDAMAFAQTPLISGLPFPSTQPAYPGGAPDFRTYAAFTIHATDAGRAALAELFDHARDNVIDRWIGGTHLTSGSVWRRDREGRLAT